MRETETGEQRSGPEIDDDLPRLGSTPMLPNVPPLTPPVSDRGPELPVVSPVLGDGRFSSSPTLPAPSPHTPPAPPVTPRTEIALPPKLIDAVVATGPEPRQHPMAHLMPEKTKPSEAALKAAAARAARKRKARRNKIITCVVALAVAAVVGPPVAKWTINAINEAGKTGDEQPVATVVESDDAGGDVTTVTTVTTPSAATASPAAP